MEPAIEPPEEVYLDEEERLEALRKYEHSLGLDEYF